VSDPVRLQKLIAHSGIASRRAVEDLIRAGRVTVDGEPAHLGQKVDPETAHVAVDGVRLPIRPDLVYYVVNKPAGVVSTADDPYGRPTVVELVPAEPRAYPVGRLDVDSEGLMLVTNDGDLTHLLTHPRFGVLKTYAVLVEGVPTPQQVRQLEQGIVLDDGPASAVSARVRDSAQGRTQLEITMAEGRKREVRRMCDALGYPVVRLFRKAIGPLSDPHLKSGDYRSLSIEEIRSLYAAATPS
jgi:23S rRNA pseudouridine2605 synthase